MKLRADNVYKYAEVILPLNLPQTLTYGIPVDLQETVKEGMRVEVALRGNKFYAGIIYELHNRKPEAYQVQPIRSILDHSPILNSRQLQFWNWVAKYYIASPGEVMLAALPAHLKLSGETRVEWMDNGALGDLVLSDETALVVDHLRLKRQLTISEIRQLCGAHRLPRVLNELIENELVFIQEGLEPSYQPKQERIVFLHEDWAEEGAMHQLFDELGRAPKQLALLMTFLQQEKKESFVSRKSLLDAAQASPSQLKSLIDKGVFIEALRDVDRLRFEAISDQQHVLLTDLQQGVLMRIQEAYHEQEVCLLQGVTGSGKTLVYIQLIRDYLQRGKQVLFLLPEIALTTQLVSRLRYYFGDELGIYHSRFSQNERVEIWEKVRKQEYKLVVGTRSALWLPFQDLGFVVVDEEHDASFKQQDPAPRFHARDAAIYFASLFQAKVLLGSATPSVESLYNVQQAKYAFAQLKERYQGVSMPAVQLVNARSLDQVYKQDIRLLTPEMQEAIREALSQKKQVILFQNKRGYAPFQICRTCGWVPQCSNCSVSLTYHKSTDKLHCHYCGTKSPVVHHCFKCGSTDIVSKTFGTQKIEEEVQQIFPKARVDRMDWDSTRGKHRFAQLIEKFQEQKIDILVGTQMLVKGLDFPNVSLVGILNADSLLHFPDFRVNERAFQLMVQVSGRAGRVDGKGKVLIQTYDLQHPVLQWIGSHDTRSFYLHEIALRQQFHYPPFCRIIKVIVRHKEEEKAIAITTEMQQAISVVQNIQVQGPVPAPVARVRNLYIWELWIKCPRESALLQEVKSVLANQRQKILAKKGFAAAQIIFDVDTM